MTCTQLPVTNKEFLLAAYRITTEKIRDCPTFALRIFCANDDDYGGNYYAKRIIPTAESMGI